MLPCALFADEKAVVPLGPHVALSEWLLYDAGLQQLSRTHTTITSLNLASSGHITDRGFACLSALSRLECVDISGCSKVMQTSWISPICLTSACRGSRS
jgi:hypothetical protein